MDSSLSKILTTAGLILVGLIALIVISSGFFTVDQGKQAVVLQFGRAIGEPIIEPGLHFKTPFVQDVREFDRRILSWDGDPNQIPTRGREFISVDTTARWRIVDALKFLESVRDESGAQSRLDDIIDSVVRDQVSSTDLVEIVRSADWDVDPSVFETEPLPSEDQAELTKKIEVGRERLEQAILADASKSMPLYGIELVDVRIKRLNYIASVQKQVFARMISERERVAAEFQSEGEGEAAKIVGDTERQQAVIESEAVREAEIIRGRADAQRTGIYNAAYSADPEFYAFLRTLESYSGTLGDGTVLILDADSDYFRYLRDAGESE